MTGDGLYVKTDSFTFLAQINTYTFETLIMKIGRMGCRLVQAATLAACIHIVFTSEVMVQDPTDLDKEDVPGRMLTLILSFFLFSLTAFSLRFIAT